MKAKVIENLCIGCGACQALAPEAFELNDNGVSQCIVPSVEDEIKDSVIEAQETCPTNAIEIE